MEGRAKDLYFDLMKKTLSFTLWPEPPIPIDAISYMASPVQRFLIKMVSSILGTKKLQLALDRNYSTAERVEGQVWPGYADTMIGLKRLDNLQFCVETAIQDKVEGDLIETGVWRGGACIFMRAILAAHGITNRRVFVADSFEGLPKPEVAKYPADKGDTFHVHAFLAVSQEQVENNFSRYGLLDEQVVFLKGWFKDTLPSAPIEKLAVLRLDGDMYGSTMDTLESLYPKLSTGGFCIIDDYALDACRQAVEAYRAKHGIRAEIKQVDWTGRYWRKE